MLLRTERLTIRRIQTEDWKAVQSIWQDFAQSPFSRYDVPHDTTDETVLARISRWAEFSGSTEHLFFAICLENRLIGYIAFNQRENGHEIGYCFHSDVHGKGYARESHLALFDYLSVLGVKRFLARTALANTPSVRLLVALGFVQTGTEEVSFSKDENGKDFIFEGGLFKLD